MFSKIQKESSSSSDPFNSLLRPSERLILTNSTCVNCGERLFGEPCMYCTCEQCGSDLQNGVCRFCNSYSYVQNSFNNAPISPPQYPTFDTQSQYEAISEVIARNQLLLEYNEQCLTNNEMLLNLMNDLKEVIRRRNQDQENELLNEQSSTINSFSSDESIPQPLSNEQMVVSFNDLKALSRNSTPEEPRIMTYQDLLAKEATRIGHSPRFIITYDDDDDEDSIQVGGIFTSSAETTLVEEKDKSISELLAKEQMKNI